MRCGLIEKEKMDKLMMFVLCILVFMPGYINGYTDPSDVAALADMYSSLGSPPQLTNWNSSNGDPCEQSWKGITCSGSRVTQIQLPNLGLSGQLGFQLSSLTSVTIFDFSNNSIGGEFPYQLPPNGQRINLANNQFTGDITYSISLMSSLRYLNLKHNQLQGQLSDMFGQLTSLAVMDISFNSLTGNLPESFSNLSSIKTLFMQNNQFTGTIDVLRNLPLENLNVANNQFTGLIPEKLKKINLHKDGNSWGSGPAPTSPPGTPPASRTDPQHESGQNQTKSDSGEGKKSRIGAGAIAGIIISILLVGGIVAFFIFKKRSKKPPTDIDIEKLDRSPLAPNERQQTRPSQPPSIVDIKTFDAPVQINVISPPLQYHKSFHNEESPEKAIVQKKANMAPINVTPFSIADLQMSTGSFNIENLLGEGSVGRVYRAQFDDGKILAVKKIKLSAISSEQSDDFMDIVSNISRLRHPNLTKLVGFCSEHGQHLLVYEFHNNGSLHEYLHPEDGDRKPLIWNSRVKIALGNARALEYLHEVCSPSVVHKNFKSANILLDSELNPHLSDVGLATCFSYANQVLEHNATSGYSAPEVSISAQYTLKSDVYSFGVVMLELLTGRKPFDSSRPRSEQSLVQWASPQLHDIDALSKMADPALNSLYPVKSLSRFADVIALCIQPEPEFRPPMSEVVQALVRLLQRTNMSKRTYGADQGTSQHNKADRDD